MAKAIADELAKMIRAGAAPSRHVGRIVDLTGVPSLAGAPAELTCHTLIWHGFPAETWPAAWRVSHKLDLSGAPHLTRLPSGLRVPVLWLRDCPSLEELPENLSADFLDASGCRSLRVWPESARVSVGSVTARECATLAELPAGLGPLSALDVRGCRRLKALPPDLVVSSWVDIARTGIESLPESMRGVGLRWNGTAISAQAAFFPGTLTAAQALAEPNAEARRVLVERIGFERFLREAKASVLHEDRDPGGVRQLLRVKLGEDEPLVCVSVGCPSTGRRYLIRVPPDMRTCHQAVAWTAGFDRAEDYRPVQET